MVSVIFIVLCFSLQNCSPFGDVSVKGCIIWSSIDSIPLTYREKRMSGAILRMRPCKSKPRHGTTIITPCTGSCRQKFSAVLPVSSLYVCMWILHDFQSVSHLQSAYSRLQGNFFLHDVTRGFYICGLI